VTEYNTRIQQVPWVLFATVAGYSERELFEAGESDTRDVDVGGRTG